MLITKEVDFDQNNHKNNICHNNKNTRPILEVNKDIIICIPQNSKVTRMRWLDHF